MAPLRIAIVGAGIAGLTCARLLAGAGLTSVIFDKSRGVGGRLATRRADGGLQFDHGAPWITPTDPAFAALLNTAEAEGAAARWQRPFGTGFVGLPGMSGIARHLGRSLDVRTGMQVSAVTPDGAGWRVTAGDQSGTYDRVILTLPSPQILRLVATDTPLTPALSAVRMAPRLTLMAAFAGHGSPDHLPSATLPSALDSVSFETSKPGRDGPPSWVAHATADFSRAHLEREMPEVAALMLPLLCDYIGRVPSEATHAVAHRWRFALVEQALGRPFLPDTAGSLYLGGDWCLGPSAEDAWSSGKAIAGAILAPGDGTLSQP